jgi:predicted SPOUT superfamily RNA methylase MTH1
MKRLLSIEFYKAEDLNDLAPNKIVTYFHKESSSIAAGRIMTVTDKACSIMNFCPEQTIHIVETECIVNEEYNVVNFKTSIKDLKELFTKKGLFS